MRHPLASWSIAACAVVLLWSMDTAHAAERHLADFQDLSASLPAGFTCEPEVTVTARAPGESAFTGDRAELQKLIGGLRAILGFECPDTTITDLLIVGEAGGREVYRGVASESGNWLLADLRMSPADAAIAETQSATEAPTVALTVGAVNVGEELTQIAQDAQESLEASTDVPSAEAAVPMLNNINARLEELSATVDQLPEEAKKVLANLLSERVMELRATADSVTGQQGVGEVVMPALEPIMAKLDAVVVRSSASNLAPAPAASAQTPDNSPIIVALDGMDLWASCASNRACLTVMAAALLGAAHLDPVFALQSLSQFIAKSRGRTTNYLAAKLSRQWHLRTCPSTETGPFCDIYTVSWTGRIANDAAYLRYISHTHSLISALADRGSPLVVVAHSWGSVVAIKTLEHLPPDTLALLVTMGSPLHTDKGNALVRTLVSTLPEDLPGRAEVLTDKLPPPVSVRYWINFYVSGSSLQSDYFATPDLPANKNIKLPPASLATHMDYFDDAANAKTIWSAIQTRVRAASPPAIAQDNGEVCTFSSPTKEKATIVGSFYAVGCPGSVRADWEIIFSNNTRVEQHMVIKSAIAYLWEGSETNGFKMQLQEQPPCKSSGMFRCREWRPNEARLQVPAGIEFNWVTGKKREEIKKRFLYY